MLDALRIAPIRWDGVPPLLLISLAIMGSPGPATISLVGAGSRYGVRRSISYLVGIITGTTAVLIAVASGITAALVAIPAIRIVLTTVSAVYICWLAYHVAVAPPLASTERPTGAFSLPGGLVLGVANPKAWVAIAAVFASTRLAAVTTEDAALKIGFLTAMIIAICSLWLIVGRSIAPVLRDPRRGRVVNVTLAVALVGATALAVFR